MKLKDLCNKIDDGGILNNQDFRELEKRVNQIKVLYMIYDVDVVIELVSNAIQLFYPCINKDASDIIFEYNLEESIEAGHVQIISL